MHHLFSAPRPALFRRTDSRLSIRRALPLFLLAALSFAAGGCANENVVDVQDEGHFRQVLADSTRPVLMVLDKDGCATCWLLEPLIGQLATEYEGRVTVARYQLMTFVFIPRSPELRQQYDVILYPTAILFVRGREVQRWAMDYDISKYRRALDQVTQPPRPVQYVQPALAPRPVQPAEANQAPKPASRPAPRKTVAAEPVIP